MFKMLILKKLSKILHYTKTCLSGTFFFAIKSVMNKSLKLKIINRSNGEITKGRIPPYSVVVPGTHKDLYAVHIIKTVDSKTRSKTSINDLLRD